MIITWYLDSPTVHKCPWWRRSLRRHSRPHLSYYPERWSLRLRWKSNNLPAFHRVKCISNAYSNCYHLLQFATAVYFVKKKTLYETLRTEKNKSQKISTFVLTKKEYVFLQPVVGSLNSLRSFFTLDNVLFWRSRWS